MARGKGKRGRGGRGASNSRGTRANPETGDDSGVEGERERELTLGKRSQGAAGAAGGAESSTKQRKKQDEQEEEDWGLEGKSFWKSRIPQSVDCNSYVMDQLPPQLKKDIWAGKYCDLTHFMPKTNELITGEMWSVVEGPEGGFNKKIVRAKISSLHEWIKCWAKYMQAMAIQHVQELPNMIAYQLIITRASETNMGLSWLFYDEQFRLKMSSHPEMEWGRIDNHLWTYCITNYASNKYETESAPLPKKVANPPTHQQAPFQRGRGGHFRPYNSRGRGRGGGDQGSQRSEVPQQTVPTKNSIKSCHLYNKGRCDRKFCTWPHICSGCGKVHPWAACPNK